jgi:heme exporter protein C
MRAYWWKILTVALLAFTLTAGLLLDVPRLPILNETIRALHFHVTMWFGMILMLDGCGGLQCQISPEQRPQA